MTIVSAIGVIAVSPSLSRTQENPTKDRTIAPYSEMIVKPAALVFKVRFGASASSETESFTISDKGTADLMVTVSPVDGSSAFVETAAGTTTLTPGGAPTTVTVAFAPGTDGTFAGTIEVMSNATKGTASREVKFSGSAKGVAPTRTPTKTATAIATPTATASSTASL
jgi:hypothetical protein